MASEYEQAEVLYPDRDIFISAQPPQGTACSPAPKYKAYNLNRSFKTCPDLSTDYYICKLSV